MDKCHTQLCASPARDFNCPWCDRYFCSDAHLQFHLADGHSDTGLITRGLKKPPAITATS